MVEFQESLNIILRSQERYTTVVFFIVLFRHHFFQLIIEGRGLKVNVRNVRAISNKVLKLTILIQLIIFECREVSLIRTGIKDLRFLQDEFVEHCYLRYMN